MWLILGLIRHFFKDVLWSVGPINCQPASLKCFHYFWSRQLTLGLEAVLLECVHTSYFRASPECQECSTSFSFPCRQAGSESINMTTLRIASSTLESAILFAECKDFVSAYPAVSKPSHNSKGCTWSFAVCYVLCFVFRGVSVVVHLKTRRAL